MWHKTQHTENLFNDKKFTPYPVPPAHAPVSVAQQHNLSSYCTTSTLHKRLIVSDNIVLRRVDDTVSY
jgi:hypothetical protein